MEVSEMAGESTLKRKAFLVDEIAARKAKRILGATTEAEAVRQSVEHVAEMEAFWKLMRRSRAKFQPGSFELP